MSDNIVAGNKFAFGEPLSASVGVNFNLTVAMPDAYSLTGKWATLTVSKFEDGPELFKLSEAGGGLTFNGQNIPVAINNDATNETAGGDDWHTLIQTYRNLRFSLDVGDDGDTSHAEYRFQGDISTDPQRGVLPDGLEVGETLTPTLGGSTISVSMLGTGAPGPAGPIGPEGPAGPGGPAGPAGAVNDGGDTDITGLVYGDGTSLSAATASQARQAAELDTADSPTFDDLTLTGDLSMADGSQVIVPDGGSMEFVNSAGSRACNWKFDGNVELYRENGDRGAYLGAQVGGGAPRVFLGYNGFVALSNTSGGNEAFLNRQGAGHFGIGTTATGTDGTLELADIIASGDIDFTGLPTSDPASAGRLWNDSGTLKISAG